MDDDNLSQLDSSRSEDLSGGAGSSSGGPNSEKQVSQASEGSKVMVNFRTTTKDKSQRRVYTSLCRHLILEIFFEVNRHQIELMGWLNPKTLQDEQL